MLIHVRKIFKSKEPFQMLLSKGRCRNGCERILNIPAIKQFQNGTFKKNNSDGNRSHPVVLLALVLNKK